MNIWLIILVAVVVTTLLRVTPVYVSKLSFINNPTFLAILDYSACAAIGCMIYLSAFAGFRFNHFSTQDYIMFAINIGILLLAFSLSLYLRRPVKTFIICITIYAIVLTVFHPF